MWGGSAFAEKLVDPDLMAGLLKAGTATTGLALFGKDNSPRSITT